MAVAVYLRLVGGTAGPAGLHMEHDTVQNFSVGSSVADSSTGDRELCS